MSVECVVFQPHAVTKTLSFSQVPRIGETVALTGAPDRFVVISVRHAARAKEDGKEPSIEIDLSPEPPHGMLS